jgi:hypothetical protein
MPAMSMPEWIAILISAVSLVFSTIFSLLANSKASKVLKQNEIYPTLLPYEMCVLPNLFDMQEYTMLPQKEQRIIDNSFNKLSVQDFSGENSLLINVCNGSNEDCVNGMLAKNVFRIKVKTEYTLGEVNYIEIVDAYSIILGSTGYVDIFPATKSTNKLYPKAGNLNINLSYFYNSMSGNSSIDFNKVKLYIDQLKKQSESSNTEESAFWNRDDTNGNNTDDLVYFADTAYLLRSYTNKKNSPSYYHLIHSYKDDQRKLQTTSLDGVEINDYMELKNNAYQKYTVITQVDSSQTFET